MAAVNVRVLTCQTNGALGLSVNENIARWRSTLQETGLTRGDNIDVIHFPECAFSRYYYRDCADLESYGGAEEEGKGAVFSFGSELAASFNAYVIVGYAEKAVDGSEGAATGAIFYNSLYVIGRDGIWF